MDLHNHNNKRPLRTTIAQGIFVFGISVVTLIIVSVLLKLIIMFVSVITAVTDIILSFIFGPFGIVTIIGLLIYYAYRKTLK